ncbi:MAG: Nif3-like dinuclear metal center hexameric protein [Thermoflexales bacterium]|nr:Nif3-like dinuclear metal center hexameric protein [Thermoflexales bacterium]
METGKLITYLDEYLRVREIEDTSQNGLQVEAPAEMRKVAFAVDACQAAADGAVAAKAQLLVVHHGLFWEKPRRLVGPLFRQARTLILGGCGLYAAHLPLDAHPEVGNNAELARQLGLRDVRPFGRYHGVEIGAAGTLEPPLPIPTLIGRLIQVLRVPPVRVLAHGTPEARRVAVISGDAVSMLEQVAEAGLDTFITGEARHGAFHSVAELGVNVLFAGHYATEAVGLQALARHLEEKFGLETVFLDLPTGM